MGFKVLLLCALLTVTQSRRLDVKIPTLGSRIIGGEDAFPGQFPYQVSLQVEWEPVMKAQHFCGGTILNERWILTAEHCIVAYEQLPEFFDLIVKAGKHDLNEKEPSEQVSAVEKYFKHKLYDEEQEVGPYDVALIKLKTPLKFNDRVVKAVLPKKESEPKGQVTLSGWGSTSADPENPVEPPVLQTVSVPIIDRKTCNDAIKKVVAEEGELLEVDLVDKTNICTGPLTGGISVCGGDSGGPLATTNEKGESEVVGVVSWGLIPCGRKGAPAVFVRVSSFVDWIEDIIKAN